MHGPMAGPFWGNLIIIALSGVITIICFVLMVRMLVKPGEADRRHPKYSVLRDEDR